jgi:hypothetical protein
MAVGEWLEEMIAHAVGILKDRAAGNLKTLPTARNCFVPRQHDKTVRIAAM